MEKDSKFDHRSVTDAGSMHLMISGKSLHPKPITPLQRLGPKFHCVWSLLLPRFLMPKFQSVHRTNSSG